MDTNCETHAPRRGQTFKTLLMLAFMAAPMIFFYDIIFFIYCGIFKAEPIIEYDAEKFYYYCFAALVLCAAASAAGIYCAAARLIAGIETRLKKFIFAAAKIFYLLPLLYMLLLGCSIAFAGGGYWDIRRALISALLAATVAASLWTYRVLVSRKNPALKVILAALSNLILLAGAAVPLFADKLPLAFCISFALQAAWLATAADISFEGFGYRLAKKAAAALLSR